MDLIGVEHVAMPRSRAELPPWTTGSAVLAGGTWIFSEPQPDITRLVDLSGFNWQPLTVDALGLHIAATCTIATLNRFVAPKEWQACDLIQPCCEALLGSFKIWNTATVGGNICLALPAGPMTALAVALSGIGTIWRPGGTVRELPIIELVTGDHCNALLPGEILRSILLPRAALQRRSAWRRISLTHLGRSAALLIGTRDVNEAFALTITAATPRPIQLAFRALPAEAALANAIEAEITAAGLWFDDIHGTPDWRRHVSLMFAEEIRRELAA
jgi:CO/xanthine dehydrogenase FAD-binding subunit